MSSTNTLNELDGTQLQALNTQGVDCHRSHVSVNLDFKDPDTNLYFDPVSTTLNITFNGTAIALSAIKVLLPLSRLSDITGVWGFQFLTDGMLAGTWVFSFTGTTAGGKIVSHVLTFTATEATVEQYFINALRMKLRDKKASPYMLDDNMRWRWGNGELYECLEDARMDIGSTPPNIVNMPYHQCYSDCHTLLLTGGFIFALESRGIFEVFQKLQYNDELSLQMDRTMFWQNAQGLKQSYDLLKLRFKRELAWHACRSIGLASGRFPLYTGRLISLSLANSQCTFGAY